ncbi:hypothetical protein [Streptomyces bobili]|uniref:hypothetical protein n=1 Tax=Streptomyces bobili TaxID=67280 RepID=UPI00371F750D
MTAVTVDAAILLADRQCFAMLDWVAERPRDERVLRAFLASIALAALRLAEALALRVRDLGLHDEGRSGLLIHLQGQTGQAEGTDGTGVVRRVPASPELVAILKAEIVRTMASVPTTPFFTCADGRPLPDVGYRRVWRHARAAVLESHQVDWRLGRHVSDLQRRLKPSEIPWHRFEAVMPLPEPQTEPTSAASR